MRPKRIPPIIRFSYRNPLSLLALVKETVTGSFNYECKLRLKPFLHAAEHHRSPILMPGEFISLILVLSILWSGPVFAATVEPPKNPNSAKGCAICHYRWIDTFFIEGRGTDLVSYQSEKVAAKSDMCFSCHDGSVLDSRARIRHGHEHKTDVKPPANIEIPKIFPLDEEGKVQCATCHTAHGVESGPNVEETIFLRVSNRDSAMCRMCHPDKDGGPDAGNHFLGVGDRKIPKILIHLGAHEGSRKNQIICETCHTAHGSAYEGYLLKGGGDSGLCLGCHGEMGMFDASGERNANHAINLAPRTATIEETLHERGAKLGYNDVITCQTCHKTHNNTIEHKFLLMVDNRQSALCLTCHPDKQRLEKTKHNLARSAEKEKNLQGETAGESGMCSACHLPHKPARESYRMDQKTDRTTALCLSCHARGRVAENKRLEGYMHPVGITVPEMAREDVYTPDPNATGHDELPKLPLYNEFGVVDETGKMTCDTCHDTHGGLAVEAADHVENIKSTLKNTLLRRPSPELCRSCHRDQFAVENTGHDFDRVFPEGNALLEQRIAEPDLCRNCHLIHSSEPESFRWNKEIVVQDTDRRAIDKCSTCHGKMGLAHEKQVPEDTHPVHIRLKADMRPSGLPLFNASGGRGDKDSMTCRTCHDPHRRSFVISENGNIVIKDDRPANRFLRTSISPESGLCIECHRDKADVRYTDHNLVITAPDATNTEGRTPYESGMCGACHQIHDVTSKAGLWARDFNTPNDLESSVPVMNRMCMSCHSENGVAAKKVPPVSSHPETLIIGLWEPGNKTKVGFPIYDKLSGNLIKAGNMSCPSCHDAHHWGEPSEQMEGMVTGNIEGDASNSFLRPHVPDRVCKQCHGPEALYMYKYFHKTSARRKG